MNLLRKGVSEVQRKPMEIMIQFVQSSLGNEKRESISSRICYICICFRNVCVQALKQGQLFFFFQLQILEKSKLSEDSLSFEEF